MVDGGADDVDVVQEWAQRMNVPRETDWSSFGGFHSLEEIIGKWGEGVYHYLNIIASS